LIRTKLSERKLPVYSKGEEIFNMVSHIVGGAFGVAVLVLCFQLTHMPLLLVQYMVQP